MKAPTHWFNRYGPFAACSEVITLAGFCWSFVRVVHDETTLFQTLFLVFFLLVYIFLRLCASIHWYDDACRGKGIELHCQRALIASCYTLAPALIFFAATHNAIPFLLATPILIFFSTATFFVISFHLRDHDPTPPNFYSDGSFLAAGHPESPHGKE